MEKHIKSLCSVFVAFCMFFLFIFPVYADDSESGGDSSYIQKANIFHWIADNVENSSFLYGIIGYQVGIVCPNAEDGYHRASSYKRTVDILGDTYYRCICDLCGASFNAYESDLKQSYEAQVAEMPATGYNSDGSLLYSSDHDRIYLYFYRGYGAYRYYCEHSGGSQILSTTDFFCTFDCGSNSACITPVSGKSDFCGVSLTFYYKGVAPIDGYYTLLSTPGVTGHYIDADGADHLVDKSYTPSSSSTYYTVGSSFICSISPPSFSDSSTHAKFASFQSFVPVYKVTPLNSSSDTTYNINSRPTSITGNYGIIGDDGKLVQVTGNTIVNETNNTYYNPATGETTPITSWSYDYSDRSYTVTKEDGDTTTITYGDENVTITEGDTVYNIYYIVNGSGSGEGEDPSTCTHDWTETSRTPPTCTASGEITYTCGLCGETKTEPIAATGHTWAETAHTEPTCTTPGQASYSCSKCGETKTETLKPTGHTWEVERTVQTTYDEDGNLTQEGYTLYKCSVCGEQYKDTEATGPPGPSPGDEGGDDKESIWDKIGNFFGSILGGVGELLEAVLGKLLDALTSLAGTLLEKLSGVVETVLTVLDELPKLFGGFLDLLSILFPFLPPEITLLLTFGVVAVVFAAIIKAIRS